MAPRVAAYVEPPMFAEMRRIREQIEMRQRQRAAEPPRTLKPIEDERRVAPDMGAAISRKTKEVRRARRSR